MTRSKKNQQRLDAVVDRDGWRCHLCGGEVEQREKSTGKPDDAVLDHVIPWSLGGPDTIDNLRLAHNSCNAVRSNTPLDEFDATGLPRKPKPRKKRTARPSMTADELREAAHALVVRTTKAQGLPEKVTDPAVLARIAEMVNAPKAVKPKRSKAKAS